MSPLHREGENLQAHAKANHKRHCGNGGSQKTGNTYKRRKTIVTKGLPKSLQLKSKKHVLKGWTSMKYHHKTRKKKKKKNEESSNKYTFMSFTKEN